MQDDTDRYSQYDITDNDPYFIDGTQCLKNRLGITNTAELNAAEQELTKITLAELAKDPVNPTFNLQHLQEIHRCIFDDIYPFAGKTRQVEIGKNQHLFLPWKLINSETTACFTALNNESNLKGLPPKEFGSRAGHYLGWINMIHPFREGNGRTQRVFIDQLAEQNNYMIEWNSISNITMSNACRNGRISKNYFELAHLISINTVGVTS